jgi:plastocyanin
MAHVDMRAPVIRRTRCDAVSAMTNTMNRLRTVALVTTALGAGCLGGQVAASGAAGRTVTLKNIAFSPKSLSVPKGSTVTFAFRDASTTHNVHSIGRRHFKAIPNRSSGSRRRTFTRAGTYRYQCTLHPGMTGRIVVH